MGLNFINSSMAKIFGKEYIFSHTICFKKMKYNSHIYMCTLSRTHIINPINFCKKIIPVHLVINEVNICIVLTINIMYFSNFYKGFMIIIGGTTIGMVSRED